MRTTIEITVQQRAKLLELAAQRGEKGFSHLVREALDAWLQAQAEQEERRRQAGRLRGALEAPLAEALRETTRGIRASWR